MRRRRVAYTAEAGADLDWIYDAIAEAVGPDTAARAATERHRAYRARRAR